METMLENRLFKIEPDLTSFTMQTAVALWKLIMVVALVPFMGKIPASGSVVEGGKMENLGRAWDELSQSSNVQWLLTLTVLSCGLQSFLGVCVIREGDGILKQSVTLFIIPIIWFFFLLYPYEGKETFNLLELIGMIFVIAGTVWYIYEDKYQKERLEK